MPRITFMAAAACAALLLPGAWVQVGIIGVAALAGFEKIEQRIDEWGIFTVSLARRKA